MLQQGSHPGDIQHFWGEEEAVALAAGGPGQGVVGGLRRGAGGQVAGGEGLDTSNYVCYLGGHRSRLP